MHCKNKPNFEQDIVLSLLSRAADSLTVSPTLKYRPYCNDAAVHCQRQQQELHFGNCAAAKKVGVKALQKEKVCLLLIKVFSTFCQETVQNHEVTCWAKHKA